MVEESQADFWASFVRAFTGGADGRPPRNIGVVSVRMDLYCPAGRREEIPPPKKLWIPRTAIAIDGHRVRYKGPTKRLWRMNRRAPGQNQTLDLISAINPDGKAPDVEIKLFALASLHNLIWRGVARSRAAHGVAVSTIFALGLERSPLAWSARTSTTLPGQARTAGEKDRQTSLGDLGALVGADVARTLRAFVPAKVSFAPSSEKLAIDLDETITGLATVVEAPPSTGPMSWKMMTPGAMAAMVWSRSTVEIGEVYEVSDNRVRAYCRKNGVDLPSLGYWRMSEEKREAIRRSIGIQNF